AQPRGRTLNDTGTRPETTRRCEGQSRPASTGTSKRLEQERRNYLDAATKLIELAQGAGGLWLTPTPAEKRRFLDLAQSNSGWRDGRLTRELPPSLCEIRRCGERGACRQACWGARNRSASHVVPEVGIEPTRGVSLSGF